MEQLSPQLRIALQRVEPPRDKRAARRRTAKRRAL
jgi:hypothetical protein